MSAEQPDPIYRIENGQKRPEVYAGCDVSSAMLDNLLAGIYTAQKCFIIFEETMMK
jgi:hypothetical protein